MNNSLIYCCLPIETKVRDLDSRLYLALKLLQKGFPCVIGAKNNVNSAMCQLEAPFIYFDKGLTPNAEEFYSQIKSNEGAIVVLDEEGGVFPRGSTNILERNSDASLKYVSLIFAWGEKSKQVLVRNKKNISSDRVIVSGHPRFDLRKPKYSKFYLDLGSKTRGELENYILINTSFSTVNGVLPFNELLKFRKKSLRQYFDIYKEERYYHYQSLVVNYFVEALKFLAVKFPDMIFVVRPHPVEDIAIYRKIFAHEKNIVVTKEGSVQEWIVNARLVIHHDCTTAIESFLAGKKVISYAPVLDYSLAQEVPILVSEIVKSKEELLNVVKLFVEDNSKEEFLDLDAQKKECVRQIIANVDFNSADLIVRKIEEYVPAFEFKKSVDRCNLDMSNSFKVVMRKLKNKYNYYNPIYKKKNFLRLANNKFSSLSINEIQDRIHIYRRLDQQLPEVNVKPVSKNTFILS